MLGAFLTALATALSLLVVDIVFGKGVDIANFPAAMIAAAAIGAINYSVKPILSGLSMPLNFVSFGAFSLIINGFCFWLASLFVPGFHVAGLPAFILGPVILSFVNTLILNYFAEKRPDLNLAGAANNSGKLDAAKNPQLQMEAGQKNKVEA